MSPDSQASHIKFIAKNNLGIKLLSDTEKKTLMDYGVWKLKKMMGKEYMGVERSTFLINTLGEISYIWRKVNVEGHVDEVLSKLKELI